MKNIMILLLICLSNTLYAGALKVDVNILPTPIIAQATVVANSYAVQQAQATAVADIYADQKGNTHPVYNIPIGHGIAEGKFPGRRDEHVLAFNDNIGTTEEDIWIVGGDYLFPPAGGIQMQIASDAAGDSTTSTGITSVFLNYLDDTWVEQSITVITYGTGPSYTTPTNIMRMQNMGLLTAGTGKKAAGNITISGVGGTPIYGRISTGRTFTRTSFWTVPEGYNFYLTDLNTSVTGLKFVRATYKANYNPHLGILMALERFHPFWESILINSAENEQFDIPICFPEHTDIKVSALSDGTGSLVQVYYGGYLVPN